MLADLDALPPGIVGEIIEGVLYTMTKPRARHQRTGLEIGSALLGPFDHGGGGPGGWWIITEPGIELPNTPEISPDVAGWRRDRMPELPVDEPIRMVPDWVCEILSPMTRRHDMLRKQPYYAKVGVPFDGVIVAMAGGSDEHNAIAARFASVLVTRARRGCRCYAPDQRFWIAATTRGRYSDGSAAPDVYRDGDRFELPNLTSAIAVDEIYDDILDRDGRSLLC